MKTKRFTKLIAFLLCFVLTFSMLQTGIVAFAAEEQPPVTDEGIVDTENPDLDEEEDVLAEAVDVSNSEQLAAALNSEAAAIRIVEDFQIDRTFYIVSDTIIYADAAHTLTRAADFGGDIFVVGQYEDGTVCEGEVSLSFGHEDFITENLLTVDGNRDNMTVDVVGTVFFGCANSHIELHIGVTVKNCYKVGNERTLLETYELSYPELIGGPVAITAGGSIEIYGGNYSNNAVLEDEDAVSSARGGAFYFFGPATIYGGTFDGNRANRGGAFYSYRTLNIYGATIKDNYSTTSGGAIYMPASTACFLNIDGENEDGNGGVVFKQNHAGDYGGAVICQGASVNINAATFTGNTANSHGGALYCSIKGDEESSAKLTITNSTLDGNVTDFSGGGLYLTGTHAYFENVTFSANHSKATANSSGARYGGGAIYSTGSYVEINEASFLNNTSDNYGAALEAHTYSKFVLNKITTSGNHATANGGFLFANSSETKLYNSAIRGNKTDSQGGAAYLTNNATLHAYITTFENNYAKNNGGALLIYTGAVTSLLHSCVFLDNTSENYGGAIYISKASVLETYNLSAKGNSALRGGFMYETTTGTTVTLNGLSVSGNTASDLGPIICGNSTGAKLYINKTNYIDVDTGDTTDDSYWSSAIANKLTVEETTAEIPGFINYGDTEETSPEDIINPNVTNAIELQTALAAEIDEITILSDFLLDRTFYVTGETTIHTNGDRTLTRAPHFGGDIFVIGEYATGDACEEPATLTIEPGADGCSLTIDGNRDNMTADVVGTVFFVCNKSNLILHDPFTVQNCYKVGNERTLDEKYSLSYTHRIGGPVIINAGSTLDIYGGTFKNNSVRDETEDNADWLSTQGGVIYSFGRTNIYSANFENNHAARGGAIYNYRKTYIYSAEFVENTASTLGGAIYMAASTACYLYTGDTTNLYDSYVLFKNNKSDSHGGAIISQGALTQIKNTEFTGNESGGHGGAIYCSAGELDTSKKNMIVEDSSFVGNSSYNNGGAIYLTKTSVQIKNVDFNENHATSNGGSYGGGAIYTTGADALFESVRFTGNSTDRYGGAVMFNSASTAVLYNITAKNNSASGGGFMYSKSTVDIYNSLIEGNSASGSAGGLMLQTDAVTNVISTVFEGNTCEDNGAALNVYTGGTQTTLNNCQFSNNKAGNFGGGFYVSSSSLLDLYNCSATGNEAYRGGFMYETTTGTVVTLNNLTVSGNTATDAAPIIWGNSTGAKLYINKTNYTDTENNNLDSAYWTAAIVNKLKVYEITDAAPECGEYGNESYENLEGFVSVKNAKELEDAINAGNSRIRIIADFTVDRTFYISSDVTIFSTTPYRITRAADFAGDIFVVGQTADGKSQLLSGNTAKLTLGNPLSDTPDLLTIDGNKNHMETDVSGSVIFVCHSATANIYANTTIVNAKKVGNVRTLNTSYTLSYSNRIGGAMAIVESGTLNVYGGNFRNLSVADEIISDELGEAGRSSTLGGAIYSLGNVNIWDSTFEFCKAARGGVIYNYRVAHIYSGEFINNYASASAGVAYLPSTALTHLYVGDTSGENKVSFTGNVSKTGGGAIYSGATCSTIIYGGTTFENNSTLKSNGGAIYASGTLLASDTVFKNNEAYSKGGAVYITRTREDLLCLPEFTNCTFTNNTAASGGALTAYASSSLTGGSNVTLENCVIKNNEANNGGALYASYKSTLNLKDTTIEGNICKKEGGALYAIYESTINADNCEFLNNTSGDETIGYGGAISLHSTFLNGNDLTFSNNTAGLRGGAIYVSYNSASLKDSIVDIKNSAFTENHCHSLGGAVYVTDRLISFGVDEEGNPLPKEDNNTVNLILSNVSFKNNTAVVKGGAVYLTTYSHTFMSDVTFDSNRITDTGSGYNAGAIYSASRATFEINGGEFTNNASGANGGAIGIYSHTTAVLNNITATGNQAVGDGGFMLCDTAYVTIHNSNISDNTAGSQGGAVSLVDLATINAYNTEFNRNSATSEGGALHVYHGESQSVLHSCSFAENTSGTLGGAIYMANCSLLDVYNSVGTNNHANKGGFIYETTYNSVLTVNGLTVSGNTDNMGGPIIWGNTLNAKILINKANYVDKDTSVLDDAYWAGAIYNLLTVNEISDPIPECPTYTQGYTPETETPPTVHPEVSVEHIFELAQNADKGKINSTYSALPKLDTSSNFMSRETTLFPNINGENVTVDSFVYQKDDPANNGNVGEGIMIYQAMCYKRAHPEEDVSIAISAYRFSANTALCLDRSSPYFGYLRPLYNEDYDKFGFVRISYLLLCAARMGINVTVIAQLDGYPNTSTSPRFENYFTEMLDAPCDSAYVSGKVIGDFMTFRACKWSLDGKGGSDMMHTKLCAVSHYLDKDGVAHRNAVWTSSSNLDGVNATGTNGLNQLQTATIISDHAEIYRVSANYLSFLANYCEQEEVYIFRDICTKLFKEQIDLINAGRESEIPADQQMVYLGGENDNVFELYFSPFSGGYSNWEEDYNPFTKQVRELSNSEDSIIFIWNNVKFGAYSLRNQLEDVIIDAFHKNKNPNNKIYVNLPGFDSAAFSDLKTGTDIGYKAFNQNDFGHVHSKDAQLSYVKDGQRYYVSLLNSMNVHNGSMAYQSNFALVIKENTGEEGSVFFALADQTTKGIVSHDYEDVVLEYIPENDNEDGYTYHPCRNCDERLILETIHRPSDWIAVKAATKDENGIAHRSCTACSALLETREYVFAGENELLVSQSFDGKQFSTERSLDSILNVNSTPYTIEATLQLDKSVNERGGVIVGNYSYTGKNLINLEVFNYGKLRLFYINDGKVTSHVFNTDIRSNETINLALTVEGTTAKLYINSTLTETAELPSELPNISDSMWIGGDKRTGNGQFFKGTIYSVHLFDHVRSEAQLALDAVAVFESENGLLASRYFTGSDATKQVGATFNDTTLNTVKTLSATPRTIEATVQLGDDFSGRGGVIVGNYSETAKNVINLEVFVNGRIRLYAVDDKGNISDCIFTPDIRGSQPVHIAITINERVATLYLNGEVAQTRTLNFNLDNSTENFVIGGDNRKYNAQYFKGYINNVSMFSDVRTAEEISKDMLSVSADAEGLLYTHTFDSTALKAPLQAVLPDGMEFTSDTNLVTDKLSANPLTFEATVQLDKSFVGRGGVIIGNYSESGKNVLNLEAYNNGKLRLYMVNNGKSTSHIFSSDIRSDSAVHIALTVDESNMARLYINSKLVENVTLSLDLPDLTDGLKTGGDNRLDNSQYFKGRIYSVNLFSSTRSAEQIENDMVQVNNTESDLIYQKFFAQNIEKTYIAPAYGVSFTESSAIDIPSLSETPRTIEATVQLTPDQAGRAGVIVGNYKELYSECISLEIYTGGRVRLFFTPTGSKKIVNCIFSTDIRGTDPAHIAVTIDGLKASLYVNGEFTETITFTAETGEQTEGYKIGGDNRDGNLQYFRGAIYSVNMFSDVRSADEIKADMTAVSADTDGLLYTNILGPATEAPAPDVLPAGQTFTAQTPFEVGEKLASTPLTMEAVIQLDTDFAGRAGVIVGNYDAKLHEMLNLEIYTEGKPRLFYTSESGSRVYCDFNTDIRSQNAVHLAVTVDGLTATLYLNGQPVEQKELPFEIPSITENFKIGGDNRPGNQQFFNGKIYSVNLYSTARTDAQIMSDAITTDVNDSTLLYSVMFASDVCAQNGHTPGEVIVDAPLTASSAELRHTECTVCGKKLSYTKVPCVTEVTEHRVWSNATGFSPATEEAGFNVENVTTTPHTIEAVVQLDKSYTQRAGVIVGNYDGGRNNQLNFEVYTNGKPRLYYSINGAAYSYIFKTDIRSTAPQHIALTVDGTQAALYVNGELRETATLTKELPVGIENLKIGADNRTGTPQYFAGTIYSVTLLESVRTADEIAVDRYLCPSASAGLLFDKSFISNK